MNTLLANTLIATAGIIRGTLASAFSYLNTLIKSGTNSAMQFHQEGIAFAREMGMNAKEAQAYTEVLTDRTEKLAMKYGVAPTTLRLWRDLYIEYGDDAFDRNKRKASKNNRIKELEKRNAELEEEIEILKKAAAFLADVGRK